MNSKRVYLNRIPLINKLCDTEVPMYVLMSKAKAHFWTYQIYMVKWGIQRKGN